MLPPRPLLLVLLFACLASLCQALQPNLLFQCGKRFRKVSDLEQAYYVTFNKEKKLTFNLRDKTECSAVVLEASSMEEALTRFATQQKTPGPFADVVKNDFKNKFFILSESIAIPWLTLDELSMLECSQEYSRTRVPIGVGFLLRVPGKGFFIDSAGLSVVVPDYTNISAITSPECEAMEQKFLQALSDRAEEKENQRLAEEEEHEYWNPPGVGYMKLHAKWLMNEEKNRLELKKKLELKEDGSSQ